MIQDLRVGITMYPGLLHHPGRRMEDTGGMSGGSADLPKIWAEGLVYTLVPFVHGDISPFSDHSLLTDGSPGGQHLLVLFWLRKWLLEGQSGRS